MLLGAHESVAGGLYNAFKAGSEDGAEVIQIFSKNANQWKAKPLTDELIDLFRDAWKESGIKKVAVHDSYLINLASPEDPLWERSIDAFKVEMERAEAISANFLVFHPGAHKGKGMVVGIERVAKALNRLHEETSDFKIKVLIETTAGQGTYLGHTFEQIKDIIDKVDEPQRLGVCYDTCHTFAAGYDIRDEDCYERTFTQFDEVLGLDRLMAFHLNDSTKGLGSKVDRHSQIGDGEIGPEGFRLLVNDKRFKDTTGILETPPLEDGKSSYKRNLALLRSYIGKETKDVAKPKGLDRFF